MTGILAIWDGDEVSRETFQRMMEVTAYRGPQGSAVAYMGDVALGQHRIHVTAEDLPEALPLTDGHLTLVADARLDDRETLASALSLSINSSDAALLLAAWRKWGRDCAAHLTGDFAFVIWDGQQRTLFAARDAMGIRPLYYARVGNLLVVGSEARQLAAHPAVSDQLSEDALWMWIQGQYDVTLPLFKEVKGLPMGHYFLSRPDKFETGAYWDFSSVQPLHYNNHDDYLQHFRELFGSCVRDRLRTSAGSVGTMLSGGMDSTSVTAMACRVSGVQLLPYSFRFRSLKDCDESVYSQAVADKCGLKVNWVECEDFWLLKGAYEDGLSREDPFQCWDLMDQWILGKLANDGARVLLTGHGGDSLMTGLGTLTLMASDVRRGNWRALSEMRTRLKAANHSVASGMVKYLVGPLLSSNLRYKLKHLAGDGRAIPSWIPKGYHAAYESIERRMASWPTVFRDWDRQQEWQLIQPISTGVRRAMHWYQRLAAPYGIEVRHPLYDRRLAEFMLAIPQKLVRYEGWVKGFLRRAMSEILPSEVAWRRDKPTLAEYYHYGVGKEAPAIFKALENSPLVAMGMIEKEPLRHAVNAYLKGDPSLVVADFLPVLITDLWLKSRN